MNLHGFLTVIAWKSSQAQPKDISHDTDSLDLKLHTQEHTHSQMHTQAHMHTVSLSVSVSISLFYARTRSRTHTHTHTHKHTYTQSECQINWFGFIWEYNEPNLRRAVMNCSQSSHTKRQYMWQAPLAVDRTNWTQITTWSIMERIGYKQTLPSKSHQTTPV